MDSLVTIQYMLSNILNHFYWLNEEVPFIYHSTILFPQLEGNVFGLHHLQIINQKVYILLEKLDQLKH